MMVLHAWSLNKIRRKVSKKSFISISFGENRIFLGGVLQGGSIEMAVSSNLI